MEPLLRNPAVVINSEAAGIGTIHALSRADVDIVAVERDWPPLLGRFSRFPKLKVIYRPSHGESLTDTLLRLSTRFEGKGVLFPGTDLDLGTLIAAREQLSERYHIPAARHLGCEIFDKNWQYEVAERIGCPLPRYVGFVAGEMPDVQGLRFPLAIKPVAQTVGASSNVFRIHFLEHPAALERCLADIAQHHRGRRFQLAEDIPGEPDQLYTVASYSDRDGRVLRSYSGRKITIYPYYFGYTGVAETLTLPPDVVRSAQSLLSAAGFHGISQVEFKFDARDGLYKLLEINPRAWLWVKLAAFSGVNLPLMQYYDLTGDARLAALLAVPQEDGHFFVYNTHALLARTPSVRARVEELRRTKALVPAIHHAGEWRLTVAYSVRSFFKQIHARMSVISETRPPWAGTRAAPR